MAAAGKRVTVSTSPTKLNTAEADRAAGSRILIRNKDASAAVDIGGPTVATGAGFQLAAGESVGDDLGPGDEVYAVTASGTVVVHVFEGGL